MIPKFGMLTHIEATSERRNGHVVSIWKCDCGNTRAIADYVVKIGRAKSCGCLKTRHGMATERPAEYGVWMGMNNRCNSPTSESADRYFFRGISVCERWRDFGNFYADMGRRPSSKYSLGRINNDLGYSPDNCRWETQRQQSVNQERSRYFHIRGELFESSADAAKWFGVHPSTIFYWIKTGKEGCYAKPRY